MKERERIVVTGVLSVLLLGWLGFLVHRSPRFAGSGVGAVFGIAGAVLMLVPLAYPIVKRIPFLNARITPHVSMQSLLTRARLRGHSRPSAGDHSHRPQVRQLAGNHADGSDAARRREWVRRSLSAHLRQPGD